MLTPGEMYIDGRWCGADNGQTFNVINPATCEVLTTVPRATRTETKRALEAAQRAFPSWSALSPNKRGEYLEKVKELILKNKDELARVITLESGKALSESEGEVVSAAQNFEWYAAEGKRVYGEIIPADGANKRIFVHRQPVGVAALITPWNFPLNILSRKIATALSAGCTVVVKPAEQTPLTAAMLWQLIDAAGLPQGVANLVIGDPQEIGQELLDNPIAKVIGFTGSTFVGKILMQGASKHVKRLALELGGHAPFIVFDDADLDLAIQAVVTNKFRNNGQTCSCVNRIFVHQSVYTNFLQKLSDAIQALVIGHGLDKYTQVGPLIDQQGLRKVKQHVEDAVSKGAAAVVGGNDISDLKGYFYPPTVLYNVTQEMLVMQEETFGPVLPVIPFVNDDEVIRMANTTPYGLYAYVYTRDIDRYMYVSEALEYGMVGVNESLVTVVQAPAGGFKESGLGREGGHWGMDEYLEVKYVAVTLGRKKW